MARTMRAGKIRRNLILAAAQSLWSNRSLIRRLSRRELEARFRGSVLGILWAVLLPLMMLAIYAFVFGSVLAACWSKPEAATAGPTEPGYAHILLRKTVESLGRDLDQHFADGTHAEGGRVPQGCDLAKRPVRTAPEGRQDQLADRLGGRFQRGRNEENHQAPLIGNLRHWVGQPAIANHRRPARGSTWTRATWASRRRASDRRPRADGGHASCDVSWRLSADMPGRRVQRAAILRSSRSRSSRRLPSGAIVHFHGVLAVEIRSDRAAMPPSIRRADKPPNEPADGARQLADAGHGRSP